jgi:hypothetical protein
VIARPGEDFRVSFGHWWIGFFADDSACERLRPHFAAAAGRAALSAAAEQTLLAWQHCPSDFEEDAFMRRPEVVAQANLLIAAFNLPGFSELARKILTEDGRFSDLLPNGICSE